MTFKHLDTVYHKITGEPVYVWETIDDELFIASDGMIYMQDEFVTEEVEDDDIEIFEHDKFAVEFEDDEFEDEDDNRASIVIVFDKDGQPRPATRPFVHDTRTEAEEEARRLSVNNPGESFGVYQLVSFSRASRPVAETFEV